LQVADDRARDGGPLDHPATIALISKIECTSKTFGTQISDVSGERPDDGIGTTSRAARIQTSDLKAHATHRRTIELRVVHCDADGRGRASHLVVVDPAGESGERAGSVCCWPVISSIAASEILRIKAQDLRRGEAEIKREEEKGEEEGKVLHHHV